MSLGGRGAPDGEKGCCAPGGSALGPPGRQHLRRDIGASLSTEARNVRASRCFRALTPRRVRSGAGSIGPASSTGKAVTPALTTPVDGGHSSGAAALAAGSKLLTFGAPRRFNVSRPRRWRARIRKRPARPLPEARVVCLAEHRFGRGANIRRLRLCAASYRGRRRRSWRLKRARWASAAPDSAIVLVGDQAVELVHQLVGLAVAARPSAAPGSR